MMIIKNELSKKELAGGNIVKIKENIKVHAYRLAELSEKSIELIEKHSLNVLRDGMTILVHSYSKSVIRVLSSATERGIRISVITTQS